MTCSSVGVFRVVLLFHDHKEHFNTPEASRHHSCLYTRSKGAERPQTAGLVLPAHVGSVVAQAYIPNLGTRFNQLMPQEACCHENYTDSQPTALGARSNRSAMVQPNGHGGAVRQSSEIQIS